MNLHTILLFFIVAALTTSVRADDTAMTKYRNLTPQQVKDMPEKTRQTKLPMAYTFAAQSGLAVDSELLFGMQLNQLMYSGIHDYKSAILAFQKDLGDPPTGVLTVWQIHQLESRSEKQKLTSVIFPDSFFSWKIDQSASVEGTVTILDDKIAWPVNHHKIKCYKSDNYCEVRQIMLDMPDAKSFSQSYHIMEDNSEVYNITRWSDDVIDAEYPSEPDSCRTTSLSLNFKTKEFYFITKNAGGKCEILGMPIEKLPRPRIAQVVDGKKIIKEEFGKITKTAYELLSSDFRKKVDQVVGQANKKQHREATTDNQAR